MTKTTPESMIDTASDKGEEQIDTRRKPEFAQPTLVKDEHMPEQLKKESFKEEASFDSSDDDWEEVEARVISLDCSAVNVLVQALRQPQVAKSTGEKKAPLVQTFPPGEPPVVSFNNQLASRVFGESEREKMLTCLKDKGDQALWYNSAIEPNVGTCIFLEVAHADADSSMKESEDSSMCSDAELIEFLQDAEPGAAISKRKKVTTQEVLKVLGIAEERISLKSRAYGAKPTQAETVFDIHDRQVKPGPKLKANVTERTKKRRRRRELKL